MSIKFVKALKPTHTCSLLLSFLSIICLFFSSASFATIPDIAANAISASCSDSALNTNNGSVNIEINWEPNTIDLHWYDGNTEMVNAGPTSCTYDGGLTPSATIPTKTGYTFMGWRARPTYDFSTLPTNVQGTARWSKGRLYDNNDHDYTAPGWCVYYDGTNYSSDCSSYADFDELGAGEWKVHFTWGDIYGSTYCSALWVSEGGTAPYEEMVNAVDATFGKQYCWCQATGYKPNGSSTKYTPISTVWISSAYTDGFGPYCYQRCSMVCAAYVLNYANFQAALFGVSQ